MTLHRALRVVLVLAGVGLMGSGLLWGFHPTPLMDLTGIKAVDAMSRNMLKSDMGGGLIDLRALHHGGHPGRHLDAGHPGARVFLPARRVGQRRGRWPDPTGPRGHHGRGRRRGGAPLALRLERAEGVDPGAAQLVLRPPRPDTARGGRGPRRAPQVESPGRPLRPEPSSSPAGSAWSRPLASARERGRPVTSRPQDGCRQVHQACERRAQGLGVDPKVSAPSHAPSPR